MKITFLGTGTSQGVPVIACPCEVCHSTDIHDNRLRSSVLIEHKGKTIIIDTGPDFRQQMLRANVMNLDAILYTHGHKDHIAGLDDIRAYNYLHQKPVDIYAEKRVQADLKREYAYVFEDFKYPGIPEINLFDINDEDFYIDDIAVTPIRVMHHKLPILGYRIGDFVYITDANFISGDELEKIKGAKVFVLNALRRKKHLSHFNLEEALEIIEETKPQTAYLTHISHMLGFHSEVQGELPPNVFLAYDCLTLFIDC